MILVVIVFVALFGLAEFSAVSNLIALPEYYASLGLGDEVPWWLLVAGVVIPPLFFGIALLLGRRRAVIERALILAVALATTHALALSAVTLAVAFVPAS